MPAALAPGNTVALTVLSVTPPGPGPVTPPGLGPVAPAAVAQAATPAAPPGAAVLTGTVAGSGVEGRPILATPEGMLSLNTDAPLPKGTRVVAALTEPAAGAAPPGAASPTAAPPPAMDVVDLALGGGGWGSLRQVLAGLAAVDRGLAQQVVTNLLPQPNRKLGAALSFFLAAVRGGDAGGWLGADATAALERGGHRELLSRLGREFREAQQQTADPLPGDWRPYTVPVFDGTGIHPVRLHVHPIGEDGEEREDRDRNDRGTRFLIDVDLSRLGPLQFDGLVRERRFDLILRSRTALAPELREELTRVFADSVGAVGYTGGLSFQAGPRGWVALTRAGGGLGVTA